MSSMLPTDFQQMLNTVQQTAMHDEAMEFGDIVRAARRKKRLSQRQLAVRLGVTGGAVAQWERGYAKPGIDTRLDIAQVLGIPFDQLLVEATDPDRLVVTDPVLIKIVKRLARLSSAEQLTFLAVLAMNPATNPPAED